MPDLLVIGAASRDLAPSDPRGWRLGGGVSYGSLTAARLGLKTAALIGVDREAAGAAELERLRDAGVDVELVPLASGPVFDNVETPTGRVQQCIATADPMDPGSLPRGWEAAASWLFAPVAAELPDSWAGVPAPSATVGLGWQGLLRRLRAGEPVHRVAPARSALLARADVVGVSVEDLAADIALDHLVRLLRPGSTLALTRGAAGGLVVAGGPDGTRAGRSYPAIPAGTVVDSTGAGDTFLAALLATRIDPRLGGGRERGADLRFAAAAASLVIEAPGLAGVPDLADLHARLASRNRVLPS